MQSGKPVAVFQTHPDAPRVLIANSNLVPQWATWEHFRALDAAGLMMYGQMTAGSWIYIGTQGILQGTYETFAAVARKRFGGTLAGRLVVTAGLGGMGGAQPLAVTMNGGCALCVEVDLQRIERRIETGYLDERAADLDDALRRLDAARGRGEALSIGLFGNAAEVLPELVRRGAAVDVVTDQTSAHDPLNGYVPAGLSVEQADALRASDPDDYLRRVGESAVAHVAAIRAAAGGRRRGLRLRQRPARARRRPRRRRRLRLPRLRARLHPPAVLRGQGPVSLGGALGRPRRHPRHRRRRSSSSSATRSTSRAGSPWRASACSSRGCRRASAGWATASATAPALRFNEMVATRRAARPVVIGRDHLDAGSVASPQRETESMLDGSDAVADWPLLNAMVNVACGASWVSIHHGGGVGMGLSIHAGQVCVADGTPGGGRAHPPRPHADPGMGIVRHADAGEPRAVDGGAAQRRADADARCTA